MLNQSGLIKSKARLVHDLQDIADFPMQVVPDGRGPWAIRYLWVQHATNNDEFVSNYFNKGNNKDGAGLNLRKQTTFMQQTAWNPHNEIFEQSRDNGNLIWRVKAANPDNDSIDYIECWRTKKVIHETFGAKRGTGTNLKEEEVGDSPLARSAEAIEELRQGLAKSGFEPRVNLDMPEVHPLKAMLWYKHFVERSKNGEQCVINTPYNVELNPWKCWLPETHPDYEPADRSFYKDWWEAKRQSINEQKEGVTA